MKIDQHFLDSVVKSINEDYCRLAFLSNEELRSSMTAIRESISSSKDTEKSLNENLTHVFALVKELQRRLAGGDIVVKATDLDRKFAKSSDFVEIVDDMAVYRNHWTVRDTEYRWNMIPYDVQIMGGVLLHYKYATEMATGEGKTLVTVMPALLNALSCKGVHVMTVNDYLSLRDFEITRPIYSFFGLTVACIEDFPHGSFGKRDAYCADVTFGSNSEFIFDYLFDNLAKTPDECVQNRSFYYAILDELDSVLIDEAETPHIVSGGQFYSLKDVYKECNAKMADILADSTNYEVDKSNRTAHYTEKGKQTIRNLMANPHIFKYTRNYELTSDDLQTEEDGKIKTQALIYTNAFIQLLFAYTIYLRDVDYIVDREKIVIIDPITGRPKVTYQWEHGLHAAIEAKERVSINDENVGSAVISLKNYFRLYEKVCGMSGTIEPVAEELKDNYGLEYYPLPTNRPIVRDDKALCVFRTQTEKEEELSRLCRELSEKGHPVLIGCISIKRSEQIAELLQNRGLDVHLLSPKELQRETYMIANAGNSGRITISTSMAGRGTDIKLDHNALEAGGLAVIIPEMFNSERIDRQLKGRSGRQGEPGLSYIFASLEDDILENLSEEERNNLFVAPDLAETSRYFKSAQLKCEERARESRQKCMIKDDIIAPYRQIFYSSRGQILRDQSKALTICESLLKSRGLSMDDLSARLDDLYDHVAKIMANKLRYDHVKKDMQIPFSNEMHLFSINFNMRETLKSKPYFIESFMQQTLLQVYDICWHKFVKYILENLDDKEIHDLPERYENTMTEIKDITVNRICKSDIPIHAESIGEEYTISFEEAQKTDKPISISLSALCPCGSGKNYGECHGRSTPHRPIHRRK